MSTTTKQGTKSTSSSNGARKAPTREIVRRLPGAKASRYLAVLSCGHRYSKGKKWHRTSLRCKRCLVDGPVKKAQVKKVAAKKAAVTAAKSVNGAKTSNGGATK